MLKETYVAELETLSKMFAIRLEEKHYIAYISWLSALDLVPSLQNSSRNCYPLEIS